MAYKLEYTVIYETGEYTEVVEKFDTEEEALDFIKEMEEEE